MPQILFDTAAESPASLRLLAALATSYAALAEAGDAKDDFAAQTVAEMVATDDGTAPSLDPTVVFGKTATWTGPPANLQNLPKVPEGTNVLPFPMPQVPTAQIPVTPAATLPVTDMPVVALLAADMAVAPVKSAQGATLPPAQTATPELDKAGIPWDARIHQSNRNQKADGTWMLKRGLDKTLAATVLAELTAAKLVPPVSTATGPVPGTGFPPASVTLPPPPVGLPLPPITPAAPVATLPPPPVGLPLPPVSNGLPATPIELFKAMMAKIGPALAAQTITQEQVALAHQALGIPQLQLAITRPELIPLIEASLGL